MRIIVFRWRAFSCLCGFFCDNLYKALCRCSYHMLSQDAPNSVFCGEPVIQSSSRCRFLHRISGKYNHPFLILYRAKQYTQAHNNVLAFSSHDHLSSSDSFLHLGGSVSMLLFALSALRIFSVLRFRAVCVRLMTLKSSLSFHLGKTIPMSLAYPCERLKSLLLRQDLSMDFLICHCGMLVCKQQNRTFYWKKIYRKTLYYIANRLWFLFYKTSQFSFKVGSNPNILYARI